MKTVKVAVSVMLFISGAVLHAYCNILAMGISRTLLTKGILNEIEAYRANPKLFVLSIILIIAGSFLTMFFCNNE